MRFPNSLGMGLQPLELSHVLLNRVCAPGDDEEQFTLHQPDGHCFPLAVVCEHWTLKVTVRCLPRLQHIPPILIGGRKYATPPQQQQQCGRTESVGMQETSVSKEATVTTRRIFSSIAHSPMDDLSRRTEALHITSSQAGLSSHLSSSNSSNGTSSAKLTSPDQLPTFPFSPPQPSPLSPKLLSGLADVLPYSGFQITVKQEESTRQVKSTVETDCPHSQSFCFDTGCVSHHPVRRSPPSEDVPRSKVNQERESIFPQRSASCSYPLSPSGVCPPSASSPLPFARKAANEKRRSLAINIKVVSLLRLFAFHLQCFVCVCVHSLTPTETSQTTSEKQLSAVCCS